MILRVATADDLPFLLRLRNDPVTRMWSRTEDELTEEGHAQWFAETTDRIFVAEETVKNIITADPNVGPGGVRVLVGTVRLVRHPHELEMGIVVAPEHRGKGYASEMIKLGAKEAWAPVVAYVREDNLKSLSAFKRAGFKEDDTYVRFHYGV
jgi:RimJ/RimL family protein N-acetyltransferase